MGAGRNTVTINCRDTLPFSNVATLLKKEDLGGVIFGCTHSTIKECLVNQLFGLPAMHFSYVKNIEPGLPLFLFNYSDRKLYGIYEAASHGQMNINPSGWTENGYGRTQYSAQVRVRLWKQCKSLLEKQYSQILPKNNINQYPNAHYLFELDRTQTAQLISQFECSSVTSSFPTVSIDAPVCGPLQDSDRSIEGVIPNLETVHDDEDLKLLNEACTQHLNMESEIPPKLHAPAMKWVSLFKDPPRTDIRSKVVGVNQLGLEAGLDVEKPACLSCTGTASQSSGITNVCRTNDSLLIDQLRTELEDLKALSMEQQRSICALEKKLSAMVIGRSRC